MLKTMDTSISQQAVLCDIEPMLYDCMLVVRLTGLDSDISVWFVIGVPYPLAVLHMLTCNGAHHVLWSIRMGSVSSARLYIYIVVICLQELICLLRSLKLFWFSNFLFKLPIRIRMMNC
jgi:hypothetical protein